MAQRLVRAKNKIRDAGILYVVPETKDMATRLDAVFTVIYLVFHEGHAATRGGALVSTDLCAEAIRMGRLVRWLMESASSVGGDSSRRASCSCMMLRGKGERLTVVKRTCS